MLIPENLFYDAIYARQSIDKADSISIESQIEFCKFEARGNPYQVFADKGFSGKNTDRPGFQRMMQQLRNGQIRRVICYKLDRCSRSILDFTALMEEFQKYNVEFVSCTERFDTSTPMGRAMLNICVVFAQLERETIQQRVTDAYRSRSQRGFYMGGRVPFGFHLEACEIEGKQTSRYGIEQAEAEILTFIFRLYAKPDASLGTVIASLQANGIKNPRSKDGKWSRSKLSKILRNPIYVKADLRIYHYFKALGVRICNDPGDFIGKNGCYLYSENENKKCLVLAPHEGILSSELWLACRKQKITRPKTTQVPSSYLTGIMRCAYCQNALVVTSRKKNDNVYRYIVCPHSYGQDRSCSGVHGWNLEPLEQATQTAVLSYLTQYHPVIQDNNGKQNESCTALDVRIAQLQCEIEKTAAKAIDVSGPILSYLSAKMEELVQEKNMLIYQRKKQYDCRSDTVFMPDYTKIWPQLTHEEKQMAARTLIESIMISDSEVHFFWRQ